MLNLSIKLLKAKYGTEWQQPQQERTWFSRRKRVIDFLRTEIRVKHLTPQVAVTRLEDIRRRSGWSIHRTADEVKKNNIQL